MPASPPAVENPERRTRRLQYLIGHPDATDTEAAAAIDEELQLEAEARAERDRHSDGIVASMKRMWTCSACGVGSSRGNRDGLCERCAPVVGQLRADALAAELVNGGASRRDLAVAYLARRRAT
jgi:hypothetical protein